MISNVALGILGSLPMAIEGTNRLIVDIAMFFGLLVIVAMACNFQYGNAGIPNMGCAIQVIVGAFGVSAITTRVAFWVAQTAGVPLIPYTSDYDWLYNNPINIGLTGNISPTKCHHKHGFVLFQYCTRYGSRSCGWMAHQSPCHQTQSNIPYDRSHYHG